MCTDEAPANAGASAMVGGWRQLSERRRNIERRVPYRLMRGV